MGNLNKLVLEFEEVFWRDVCYFGHVNRDDNGFDTDWYFRRESQRGEFFMFWNLSRATKKPILVALIAGEAADTSEQNTDEELVDACFDVLQTVWGDRGAGRFFPRVHIECCVRFMAARFPVRLGLFERIGDRTHLREDAMHIAENVVMVEMITRTWPSR